MAESGTRRPTPPPPRSLPGEDRVRLRTWLPLQVFLSSQERLIQIIDVFSASSCHLRNYLLLLCACTTRGHALILIQPCLPQSHATCSTLCLAPQQPISKRHSRSLHRRSRQRIKEEPHSLPSASMPLPTRTAGSKSGNPRQVRQSSLFSSHSLRATKSLSASSLRSVHGTKVKASNASGPKSR